MTEVNIHNKYIDKRINDIKKSNKWKSKLIDTSHEDFIKDYASNVFTNLIKTHLLIHILSNFHVANVAILQLKDVMELVKKDHYY